MTPISQIDYSPLDKMHHSGWHVFKSSFNGYGVAVFIGVLLICIALAITPVGQIGFMLLFVYIVVLASKINSYKNHIWQDFADANKWPIDNINSELSLIAPSIDYGHNKNLGLPIKAQIGGLSCDLYIYDTTTGEGKYQTTHFFTLAMVGLPKILPHIILNSKKDKADIKSRFPDYEKLKLEGDFNDYFSLLIGRGQEVDVLSILTPDVMQTLINANADEDIEINSQQLYFILRNDKRDPKSIKQLIDSVAALSSQIIQNISLTSLPPAAPQPAQTPKATSPAPGAVTPA